jgi:hypothetical protein
MTRCLSSEEEVDTANPDLVPEPQLRVDPRDAVHPAAVLMDLLDLLGQPRVRERRCEGARALPVVKAVRFTPNTRRITATGKFVFSAATNE